MSTPENILFLFAGVHGAENYQGPELFSEDLW